MFAQSCRIQSLVSSTVCGGCWQVGQLNTHTVCLRSYTVYCAACAKWSLALFCWNTHGKDIALMAAYVCLWYLNTYVSQPCSRHWCTPADALFFCLNRFFLHFWHNLMMTTFFSFFQKIRWNVDSSNHRIRFHGIQSFWHELGSRELRNISAQNWWLLSCMKAFRSLVIFTTAS